MPMWAKLSYWTKLRLCFALLAPPAILIGDMIGTVIGGLLRR